jgi:hypothetical protein
VFPLSKQSPPKFLVVKPAVMIGATHIEVHIRCGYKHCMCQVYTKVALARPSMCRHGLGTQLIKRLSTSHMLIVIEKTQSTFVAIPSVVTIRGGIVN